MDDLEIIVRGKGSDISNDFYEPINIPIEQVEAKIGIKGFATFNNIPNILEEHNNKLKIKELGKGICFGHRGIRIGNDKQAVNGVGWSHISQTEKRG